MRRLLCGELLFIIVVCMYIYIYSTVDELWPPCIYLRRFNFKIFLTFDYFLSYCRIRKSLESLTLGRPRLVDRTVTDYILVLIIFKFVEAVMAQYHSMLL